MVLITVPSDPLKYGIKLMLIHMRDFGNDCFPHFTDKEAEVRSYLALLYLAMLECLVVQDY